MSIKIEGEGLKQLIESLSKQQQQKQETEEELGKRDLRKKRLDVLIAGIIALFFTFWLFFIYKG